MEKHLNRQALIEAAQRQPFTLNDHLQSCAECRDAVNLLRVYPVYGRLPLLDAPSPWVERAAAIAEKADILGQVKTVVSRLTFDSWAVPQLIGVREQSTLGDRRVRFETKSIILDLRAEHQPDGWAFVAQVTGQDRFTAGAILGVGRKKLRADSTGFFQWTSRRPPTTVTIRSGRLIVVTPELSWKRP